MRIVPDQHSFPVHLTGGLPVVSAPAELDVTNAVQLRTALLSAGGQSATVVVDMSQTVFCDSASLSTLLRAHVRAKADGGEVRLVITAVQILRIFALTGADRLFPIFVSLTEALGSVPASPEAPEDPSIVSLAIVSSPLPAKPSAAECQLSSVRASAAEHAPGRGVFRGVFRGTRNPQPSDP
jgi:anti-sigma B factor antagonist